MNHLGVGDVLQMSSVSPFQLLWTADCLGSCLICGHLINRTFLFFAWELCLVRVLFVSPALSSMTSCKTLIARDAIGDKWGLASGRQPFQCTHFPDDCL